jgi:hypothetical protein
MMRTKKPVIGNIYEVLLSKESKGYIQYIGNDQTQLNSDVIRVFKRRDAVIAQNLSQKEIVNGDVEFYAHVSDVNLGIKKNIWQLVGNDANVGNYDSVTFRTSRDSGNSAVGSSDAWDVWKMSQPSKFVGTLAGADKNADIGSVLPIEWIVERMKTGKYQFVYPDYQ